MTDPSPDTPEATVYIPSERAHPGDAEVTLELRRLTDGRLAMPAFHTLDALIHGCGPDQPWAGIDAATFPEVVQRSGVDLVLWDEVLHREPPRYGAPAQHAEAAPRIDPASAVAPPLHVDSGWRYHGDVR